MIGSAFRNTPACYERNLEERGPRLVMMIVYRFGLNTTREPHEIYGTKFFFYIVKISLVYGGVDCSLCAPQPRYQSDF